MERTTLGQSGITVSKLCLGTMTWGSVQNSETDAQAQLDMAVQQGIDFLDTAEIYAVPPNAETQGLTERYIGNWLAARGNRERLVIATKAAGKGGVSWVRGEQRRADRENLRAAVDASLERLQTDYIDLYQLHWPDRVTNRFGRRQYSHMPERDGASVEETLEALQELTEAGKIRAIGLSNETPWGLMKFLQVADSHNLPRVATIQNPYNLLNRQFEIGLAEICLREGVGLLAYSPLAGGTLSGKYLEGAVPEGSRRAIDQRGSRYVTHNADVATRAYLDLAQRCGLNPIHMALAFVRQQPFVACPIIGATSLDQLQENITSLRVSLSADVHSAIDEIREIYPDPCP